MSKWIDIDDISLLKTVSVGGLSAKALWKRIRQQPSIDIVHCKDCKYLRYCETEDLDLYLDCDCPDGGGIPRNEDWYCADGEREDNE